MATGSAALAKAPFPGLRTKSKPSQARHTSTVNRRHCHVSTAPLAKPACPCWAPVLPNVCTVRGLAKKHSPPRGCHWKEKKHETLPDPGDSSLSHAVRSLSCEPKLLLQAPCKMRKSMLLQLGYAYPWGRVTDGMVVWGPQDSDMQSLTVASFRNRK